MKSCPMVNVEPAVSKHEKTLSMEKSLRRRAVGVTGSTTGLFRRGLECSGNRPIGIIVTSAAVKHMNRDTTYTSGFEERNMSVAIAIAPY